MSRIISLIRTVAPGLLLMTLVACASNAPSRFYVLSSLPSSDGKSEMASDRPRVTIGIGPVELPAYLDREQIVTMVSANELHLAGFDEWAEPLKDNFIRVLVENLSVLLSKNLFRIFPFRGSESIDYQVEVEVFRFDGRLGKEASLMTHWSIFGADDKKLLLAKKSSFKEVTGGPGYEALVAAQSRTVEAFSREIAGAIKGLSGGR